MRNNVALLLFAFCTMLFSQTALAEDPLPGDSCAGYAAGNYARSGGPEIPGAGHFMICDGTNWVSFMDYADTGHVLMKFDYDSTGCTAAIEGAVRYNSGSSSFEGCDGASWGSLGGGSGGSTGMGAYIAKTFNGDHTAPEDGMITAYAEESGTNCIITGLVDAVTIISSESNSALNGTSITFAAPSGSTYRVNDNGQCGSSAMWYISLGSDSSGDNIPDVFEFTDETGVLLSTLQESDILQITGIDNSIGTSISGDGTSNYRICNDATCSSVDHNWGSGPQLIDNNQYVQLRLTSSASAATTNSAVLIIGQLSDTWAVETDTEKVVFVLSTAWAGYSFGGLSGADAKCQADADANTLSGTFKAWLSTSATSASSRLTHATTIYKLPSGVKIADDWNDLTDGTLDNAINQLADGAPAGASAVWTGTNSDGSAVASVNDNCNYWVGNTLGRNGSTFSATSAWTYNTRQGCASSYKLYCFQQ